MADPYAPTQFNYGDPNEFMGQLAAAAGTVTPAQQAAYAQSLGYNVLGDVARGSFQGVPTTTPLSYFTPPGMRQGDTRIPPVLLQALMRDTSVMQEAANRQFQRNVGAQDAISQFLGQAPGQIMGAGQQTAGELGGLADMYRAQGMQQLQDWLGTAGGMYGQVSGNIDQLQQGIGGVQEGIRGRIGRLEEAGQRIGGLEGDVEEGYALADQAKAGYAKAMSEYKNMTVEQASSNAYAIRRSAQSQIKEIQSSGLDQATQMALIQQVQTDVGAQVQQQTTGLLSSFNDNMMSFQKNLADLGMAGAGMRLQGAQIKQAGEQLRLGVEGAIGEAQGQLLQGEAQKAQLEQLRSTMGTELAGQYIQAQTNLSQMWEQAASFNAMSSQITNAAVLSAANLEMEGLFGLAGLIQQNPESIVSWFNGLLQLYSAASAGAGTGVTA